MSLLQVAKTPKSSSIAAAKAAYATYRNTFFDDAENAANESALDAIMDQLDGVVEEEVQEQEESEKERKLRLWKEQQPKPAKHADAALVTMTILVEPPRHTMEKAARQKDELGDVRQKVEETASDMKWAVMPMVPYAIDAINDVNALVGVDAIEIDEEKFDKPKEVAVRQAYKRNPWEVLDRPEQSNLTSPTYKHSKRVKKLLNMDLTPEEQEEERLAALEAQALQEDENQLILDAKSQDKEGNETESTDKAIDKSEVSQRKKKTKKRAKGEEGTSKEVNATAASDAVAPGKDSTRKNAHEPSYLDDTTNLNGLEDKDMQDGTSQPPLNPAMTEIDGAPMDQLDPDERKRREFLSMLRAKAIRDDPEAYNRTRLKVVPVVPGLTSRALEVTIPTTAEVTDSLRDSLRSQLEPKFVKDVMDATERKRFEALAIQEVAIAACLPEENIHIEEIRRLPPNDPRLVALKQRNEDFQQVVKEREEEEKIRIQEDRERRKAEMNPQLIGVDPDYVESLRDFVEDASERLGYDPDLMIEKMGLTHEQVKWKRYDKDFEVTAEGTLVPAGTALRLTKALTMRTQREKERDEAYAYRDKILLEQDFLTPEDQEIFEECYDVYQGIADRIQEVQDVVDAEREKKRQDQQEEGRHQAFVENLIRTYVAPRKRKKNGELKKANKLSFVFAQCYADMADIVHKRALEEAQISKDQMDMHREDVQSRLPGQPEVTDCICALIEGVVDHYQKERYHSRGDRS